VTARVLVIDNYDSFVYNLVQYLGELGAEPIVHRHDAITTDEAAALEPDAVLVSPGPGRPEDAGVSTSIIRWAAGRIPVLGVCLGHQCIGAAWGGNVIRAPEVMHGKTSRIHHEGAGVFAGLPSPFEATRYHSLLVERSSLPEEFEVTASTEDGLVMGLRHRDLDVEGVQCVIHFDPPENGKAYKHRSGRTARAGSTGTVVSLVQGSQNKKYRRIQNEAGIRCKFTEPDVEMLEEREFIPAPAGKPERREKSRSPRYNRKRARRYRKSAQYRSSNHGSGHSKGRRKSKRNGRSRGKLKKADSRA
jgi:anthranilate synthase/aminodeoxychorismate synthase-like glutamine amidotransferase